MQKSELEQYKQYVSTHLKQIIPLLQKYALGDFSESIEIPKKEDEFTELFVGLSLMMDDIRELINNEEDRATRLAIRVDKINETIRKVARGYYSSQVEVTEKNDELDSLAMGINMMIDDIKTSYEDLNKQRSELSTSNKHLQQEITKRKRAEDALKQQNEFLSNIIESLSHPFYVIDVNDYMIKMANYATIGRSSEEITTCYALTHKRDKPCRGEEHHCPLEEIKKTKKPVTLEHIHYDKDGNVRNVEVHAFPIFDGEGNVVQIIEYCLDVTEQKKVEEALRESEERFRNIYENALVGIFRTTPDGRILMANPALVRMLGFSSFEELAQRNLEEEGYEPQYDRSVFKERIEREGQISGLGSTWLKPDGTKLYFRENAKAVCNNAGDILYYDGTVEDITELRRAEEKLQQYATDLEQSNKEIKQFAFIVSHDLRAPLVNLKGFSTELRSALEVINSAMNTVLPELDKKQQSAVTTALQEDVPEALDFIESSVSRMDNFISSVLKLSRLGRRELKFETVNMNMLVQDILKSLAHQIEERKTKVMVKSLPDVLADQVSMELIMGNILTNAVLYLDPNRSGEIEVTAERSSNGTIFSVRDNGCGIAKKDMDKVFTPFRRVGKVDVPGEGMGLSYVQTLVRRHSGHIWYDSKPGVGTTFSFTIANQPVKGNSHD